MREILNAVGIAGRQTKVSWFWLALLVAVIFTITGIILGDRFDAYQTAATL
jgi:cytochrome b subunit of formate dehydrogenase